MKKYKQNISGFSILSTIIICMILTVIGFFVVDSGNMLNNARIRSFMDEISGYRNDIIDFQLKKGRWPGDFNQDGYFGWCGGIGCPGVYRSNVYTNNTESYTNYMFASPYDKLPAHSFVAPFIDIYLTRGGAAFRPNEKSYDKLIIGETVPYVESLGNLYWYFYTFGYFKNPKDTVYSFLDNVAKNTIWFGSDSVDGLNVRRYLKTFKILDEKMDDGQYETGNVRSYCSQKGCSRIFIMLTSNN